MSLPHALIFLGTAFQEMFGEEIKKNTISPQLTLVVSQYLTTNIEPFKVQFMSEIVLKRLLTMNVYREIKIKKDSEGNQQKQDEKELIIMTKGKPIDYFVLIIEGKLLTYLLEVPSIFATSKKDRQLLRQKVHQRISVMKTNNGVFVVFKTMPILWNHFSITEIL